MRRDVMGKHKGFYTFGHSAHSPMFEEPERTLKVLLTDVLVGATDLADPTAEVAPRKSR